MTLREAWNEFQNAEQPAYGIIRRVDRGADWMTVWSFTIYGRYSRTIGRWCMADEHTAKIELPPLDFGGHGFPTCDCDLEGGDSSCTITPPFKSGYEQRCEQLLSALERIAELEQQQVKLKELLREIKDSGDKLYWWCVEGCECELDELYQKIKAVTGE